MRKYALTKKNVDEVKKVMLYLADGGCYLFFYEKVDSVFGNGDNWFETLQDAEDYCEDEHGISKSEWIAIEDPLPHAQHDTFQQIRVVGRDKGKEQWGEFEVFVDGEWLPYTE